MHYYVPKLELVVKDLIGAPYTELLDCWLLAHHLYTQNFNIELKKDLFANTEKFVEVWQKDYTSDFTTLLQDWDLVLFRNHNIFVDHCGLVIAPEKFVHTDELHGINIRSLSRYKNKVFQIVRLQHLW